MAHTAATFKARYTPTFDATSDAKVTLVLAEATRRTDLRVFGDRFDEAVALRTAHILSLDPGGQMARLSGVSMGEDSLRLTAYGSDLQKLIRERGGGAWAAGQMSDTVVTQ